jgi:hypothetical protein
MPATEIALSFADHPSLVDEEFLAKVADILERLRAQSEMRGHPLLASLLAITKEEAEDDLRTRTSEFHNGGLLAEADDSVVRMAQRLACGSRAPDDEEEESDAPREIVRAIPFGRA